jgi:CTP:molybdopterin cytidylyltransferase MocA
VLAAGAGTRFGGAKQLARAGERTLVATAARRALASCPAGVVVVTGCHASAVECALRRIDVATVRNRRWRSGIAGSLRRGVEALGAAPAAVLVLLCDQAAVTAPDLQRLTVAWRTRPGCIAAARYGGGLGVPAIFPRRYWASLRRLRGDRGARSVIGAAATVTAVDLPSAAFDIDTAADLRALRAGLPAARAGV